MTIAFLYEHPTWSEKLIQVLQDRIPSLRPINVSELAFDTDAIPDGMTGAINRINIMPSSSRPTQVVFQTMHYLNWLEQQGIRVLNGYRAQVVGSSKVMQNGILASLNLPHPKGIAIFRPQDALEAANKMGYPVITKPNIGGSGSGIGLYHTPEELEQAVTFKAIDFGVDRTGLVQQYIPNDGFVYRVEVLGDKLFYSIKQPIVSGQFNYCAADGCATEAPGSQASDSDEGDFDFCALNNEAGIQLHEPSPTIIAQVAKIVSAAGADFGGVEYFINNETGQPCFYDINPYSNFVSDEDLLGFSPEARFTQFVCDQFDLA